MSILYTDGGVLERNPSEIGGTWAWVLVTDNDKELILQRSGVIVAGANPVTNNQTEFYAIIAGLLGAHNLCQDVQEVRSDSKVSLYRIFEGWGITNIPEWIRRYHKIAISKYEHRSWSTVIEMRYTLLDGHPTKAQLEAGIGKRGHPVSK